MKVTSILLLLLLFAIVVSCCTQKKISGTNPDICKTWLLVEGLGNSEHKCEKTYTIQFKEDNTVVSKLNYLVFNGYYELEGNTIKKLTPRIDVKVLLETCGITLTERMEYNLDLSCAKYYKIQDEELTIFYEYENIQGSLRYKLLK